MRTVVPKVTVAPSLASTPSAGLKPAAAEGKAALMKLRAKAFRMRRMTEI